MAFNNYLEDEKDKPYFTTNSLAYYYDKMEGFAKAVEGSAKALNLTKEEVEKRLTLYIEQNKNELDQRMAQWDGKLETFDSSVETLLTEWVDDGTLTHVIDSTLIDQRLAPVTAQLAEKLVKGQVSVSDIDKNKGKLDQTYLSDGLLQQIAGTAPVNATPADGSVTIEKIGFTKVISRNLFNKKTASNGFIDPSNGKFVSSGTNYSSYFIDVIPGETLEFSNNVSHYGLYTENETFVSGTMPSPAITYLVIPSGIYKVRVSFYFTNLDVFMVAKGTLPPQYEPFIVGIDEKYVPKQDVGKTVSEMLLETSNKNRFDKTKAVVGRYLEVGGVLTVNANLSTSDYIPVVEGSKITVTQMRTLGFFPEIKSDTMFGYIADGLYPSPYIVTVPVGAKFMRVSYKTEIVDTFQVEVGDVPTSYEPFNKPIIKKSFLPSMEYAPTEKENTETRSIIKKDVLANSEIMSLQNNSVKKNKTLSFSAKVGSFSSLRIGHGESVYGASYIEITNTAISVYNMNVTAELQTTFNHNLAIAKFINVFLSVDGDSMITIRLITESGSYESPAYKWNGYNGSPFVKSLGSVLNGCELVWDTSDYEKPIFAFGDSYFGLTAENRWVYYIREYGFDNWLLNGFPGQNSASSRAMAAFLLSKRKPKYLLWALGMNDGDTDAVNPNWKSTFDYMSGYCDSHGIEFIACTVPNTPTVSNVFKNEIVRNSGYRYIDFNKAVGGDESTAWYQGMLDVDRVHPTILGAKQLAHRAMLDFPEIAR